jgi:hypothetical protein
MHILLNSITTAVLLKSLDYTTGCVTNVFTKIFHFNLYHSGMRRIPKCDNTLWRLSMK